MICGSGGSKSRLAKAAGAEPAGQMRDEKLHAVVARSTFPSQNVQNTPGSDHFWKLRCWKSARRCGAKHISKSKCTKHTRFGPLLEVEMLKKCTPLWREAHFQVKMYKTHQVRTTFGSWDVEKVHAVVARSTFPSQNVQNTPCSDHFWRFRRRKSACRCGAKHISKSKCTKHTMLGPLLEVQTSKKCMPLWREAHFSKSKCTKHTMLGPLLEVQTSKKCMPLWREAHFEVKMLKTLGVRTTFGGLDVPSLRFTTQHYTTLPSTTLHYITLHYTPLQLQVQLQLHNYTPLHSTTLHYTQLHYTTLHYTTLHSTTLHYATLHSTTLQLHNYTTTLHYTPLHSTPLHYTPLHYITLHYITLNDTAPQTDR